MALSVETTEYADSVHGLGSKRSDLAGRHPHVNAPLSFRISNISVYLVACLGSR